MSFNRRDFLKITGAATAGMALPSFADAFAAKSETNVFGLQLYAVRDAIGKDPKGVLKQIAAMGYSGVEPSEHTTLGMFYGMGNKGFKSYMNDLGMKIKSVHCNVYKDFEKKVEETSAIGIEYLIYNWEGPGKKLDDYKKMADDFNAKGEYCKQHGIKFAFHNHDFSFKEMEGVLPQEWLLDHTDKNLVDYQVDFFWVIVAGKDPVTHINKYPDRYKLCHFKDLPKDDTERMKSGIATYGGEKHGIIELGTGGINFQSILDKIKGSSIKYYIVDQDSCNDRADPLACIREDAEYMKKLKW
jgi:sugar phosphate isomerase/epimerase